jgi:hypothetical protein
MAALLERSVRGLRMLFNDPAGFIAQVRERLASSSGAGHALRTTYAEWLQADLTARSQDRAPHSDATLTLMTTVYERTDAGYLEETARCLLSQSHPFHEWIVLAHGPVPPAVDQLLSDLAKDARIRVHRIPVNLGIAGGTRYCIERATGDYVIPVDADDLLTPDALARVAAAIQRTTGARYFYSDEDALVSGVPCEPYWRPDWDPVLNWTSSYIWHLCVLHRATALGLGVYTDRGSDFCHDWDTAFRFWNAGHAPVHIPEILYHWRQHDASTTNRPEAGDTSGGSLASTRHVLEKQIERLPHPGRYEVEAFPIFRGATEWHVARRSVEPAGMDLLMFARNADRACATLDSVAAHTDYPLAKIVIVENRELPAACRQKLAATVRSLASRGAAQLEYVSGDGVSGFAAAISRTAQPLVAVCSDAIEFIDGVWAWEALKWMELCGDTALACGRLMDRAGLIVHGAVVFDGAGRARALDCGQPESYGGKYAVLLKPHTVHVPPVDFFIGKGDFLRTAIMNLGSRAGTLGVDLGAQSMERGSRVVFSPLIRAHVVSTPILAMGAHATQAAYDSLLRNQSRHPTPALLSALRYIDTPLARF